MRTQLNQYHYGKVLPKKCLNMWCAVVMFKPPKYSYRQWNDKKYCSQKCGAQSPLHMNPFTVGRIVTEQTRKNIGAKVGLWQIGRKGELSNAWKGGRDPKDSYLYDDWRNAVLKRDNYTCVNCGSRKRLEADHIKSFANYTELRYEVSNGRTLCHDCHVQTPNYGSRARKEKVFLTTVML